MSVAYLNRRLRPNIFVLPRIELFWLSPGDGLEDLPPSPIWF
jgi:hypothetical protein